jgi:hypothetical protein
MADYPSIPFILDSKEKRKDPVLLSIARSGAPKARLLYDRPRREFTLVHRGLTDAQKQELDAWLEANRTTTWQITWPCKVGGVVYTVMPKDGENDWIKPEGLWATDIAVIEA